MLLALHVGSALCAGELEVYDRGRLRKVADPANALVADRLSDVDFQRLHGLFEALASDDFDERQRAQEAIVKYGPRAASVARTFENHDDAEVRQFARGFPQFLILHYHGYLPVAPELKAALESPRRMFIGKQESFRSALERFLRDSELTAAFPWKNCPERVIGTNETIEFNLPAGQALNTLLAFVDMTAVPRGGGIAGVTRDRVQAMTTQEHDFPMVSLSPAERERFAALMTAWLPAASEVTVRGNGIRVRGNEGALRLAARAMYFVAPDALNLPQCEASAAIVPMEPGRDAVRALFDALEAPVAEFSMAGIEPLRALARLRVAGHPVEIDHSTPELVPAQPAVSLELRGLPLGLTLQWLMLRANTAEVNKGTPEVRLEFRAALAETSKPHVVAQLAAAERAAALSETVGYSDVSFLYTANDTDTAVCERIRVQFDGEMALFPCAESDFAVFVFKRCLISRGPPVLVARLNEFVRFWRETKMPPHTKWTDDLTERLQRDVEWNGRDLTVRDVLPRLRDVTGINILLERPNPDLTVDSHDMELLPPGKHSAKALIQRLGAVSKATPIPHWGVIVLTLTPANEAEKPSKR